MNSLLDDNIHELSGSSNYIIGIDSNSCIVNDGGKDHNVDLSAYKLIDENCKNFGSTIQGRIESAISNTSIKYKCPILLSEEQKIIIIPMSSYQDNDCIWLFLNNIKKYDEAENGKTEITFIDNQKKVFDFSYYIFKNQHSKGTELYHKYVCINNR